MIDGLQVANRGFVFASSIRGIEFVTAAVQSQGRSAYDTGIGVEVVPLAPAIQSVTHLCVAGHEEVPPVGKAFPTGAHCAR